MTQNTPSYVGIDIGKASFDVAVRQSGEAWIAQNEAMGIQKTVERLVSLNPALIVLSLPFHTRSSDTVWFFA